MKDILKIAQYNFTKPDFYESSQYLKRKISALAKQLGIRRLEDLGHHPLFSSYLTKAINFTKSGRHVKAHDCYIQIILSILNALRRKKSNAHYQDILNIRHQNEVVQMKDRNIAAQKQQLAQRDQQINGLQGQLDKSDKQVSELQQQLGQSEHQRNELQGQLDKSEQQRNKLLQKQQQREQQRNKLQQQLDQCKQQRDAKNSELENAKKAFKDRKNEMLELLYSAEKRVVDVQKNSYNNFKILLGNCDQEKLPKVNNKEAEAVLQEYYDNLTFPPPNLLLKVFSSRFWAQNIAGNDKDLYIRILDFLRKERKNHINNIKRLEASNPYYNSQIRQIEQDLKMLA